MRNLSSFILLLMLCFSCAKENSSSDITLPPSSPSIKSIQPLTVGSYWTYANFMLDSINGDIELADVDTLAITGDTSINGFTNAVFGGIRYPSSDWGYYTW
jgi:hypothetical protein